VKIRLLTAQPYPPRVVGADVKPVLFGKPLFGSQILGTCWAIWHPQRFAECLSQYARDTAGARQQRSPEGLRYNRQTEGPARAKFPPTPGFRPVPSRPFPCEKDAPRSRGNRIEINLGTISKRAPFSGQSSAVLHQCAVAGLRERAMVAPDNPSAFPKRANLRRRSGNRPLSFQPKGIQRILEDALHGKIVSPSSLPVISESEFLRLTHDARLQASKAILGTPAITTNRQL